MAKRPVANPALFVRHNVDGCAPRSRVAEPGTVADEWSVPRRSLRLAVSVTAFGGKAEMPAVPLLHQEDRALGTGWIEKWREDPAIETRQAQNTDTSQISVVAVCLVPS
ncbi:hypothetical protein N7532_008218 [Penicillium argentinense]|uniref:Uncharacterized protein n=1 Tax=Penicillium argentinense TaxID=1131581 RepID=A0A9W9K1E3_9EURO|nr:uncharacterized protein N7532_008218 [Penicillium argentinense]KAJ5089534.1 hypothetical protein N7532_008218 [Penicillium argentinense]